MTKITKTVSSTSLAARPQQAAPVPAPVAFTRVYVDIHAEVNRALEIAAVQQGKTKKAFIEAAILAAVQLAQDEQAGQPAKGKK